MRVPQKTISPPARRSGGSSSPIMAAPVMDLPAPDAPTSPSTSPAATSKETSSTARSAPLRVAISTRRSRPASRLPGIAQLGIERVAQPVSKQTYRQRQHDQRCARKNRNPPVAGEQKFVADAHERPERRRRRRHAHAEEAQSRL